MPSQVSSAVSSVVEPTAAGSAAEIQRNAAIYGGGFDMPPLVGAAAVTAGGALIGSVLSSRSSNKATDASSKANQEALDYTKEVEAARRAEYDQAMSAYRQQWEAWNGQRMALLGRYGVDVSKMQAAPTPQGYAPNAAQGFVGTFGQDPRTANAAGAAAQGGQTVADILQRGGQNAGKWNDWGQYGLPTA